MNYSLWKELFEDALRSALTSMHIVSCILDSIMSDYFWIIDGLASTFRLLHSSHDHSVSFIMIAMGLQCHERRRKRMSGVGQRKDIVL
jgi:hypothetical protein